MSYAIISILIPLLLSGCASGIFSVDRGVAKLSVPFDWPGAQAKGLDSPLDHVYVDMPKSELYELFKGFKQGVYHQKDNQEWITFYLPETQNPTLRVTFFLLDGKVKEWKKE